MPSQITNYQCPSCTGPLRYDGASGKLQCDYCGSSFTTAEIEKIYQHKLEEAEQAAVASTAAAAAAAEAEETDENGDVRVVDTHKFVVESVENVQPVLRSYQMSVPSMVQFHLDTERSFRDEYEDPSGHPFRIYDVSMDKVRTMKYRVREKALLDGKVREC